MKCPYCGQTQDRVTDSRPWDDASVIRRRRKCLVCQKRFDTFERVEPLPLMVVKKDGRREPFDPGKLKQGILKACQKRPVPIDEIERTVNAIIHQLQDYVMEVSSQTVGEKVLEHLKRLDSVAYLRFVSVYRQFQNAESFMEAAKELKLEGGRQHDVKRGDKDVAKEFGS